VGLLKKSRTQGKENKEIETHRDNQGADSSAPDENRFPNFRAPQKERVAEQRQKKRAIDSNVKVNSGEIKPPSSHKRKQKKF